VGDGGSGFHGAALLWTAAIGRPKSYHTPCIAMAVGTTIGIVTGCSQRVDVTLGGVLVLDSFLRFFDIGGIVACTTASAAPTPLVEEGGMQPLVKDCPVARMSGRATQAGAGIAP